jgi:hypothetical protein
MHFIGKTINEGSESYSLDEALDVYVVGEWFHKEAQRHKGIPLSRDRLRHKVLLLIYFINVANVVKKSVAGLI